MEKSNFRDGGEIEGEGSHNVVDDLWRNIFVEYGEEVALVACISLDLTPLLCYDPNGALLST